MKMDYKQPDFYRFNEDSTKLIHFVKNHLNFNPDSVLDLGAGCGVLGIEFCQGKRHELTLVEAQEEFLPSLQDNLDIFKLKAEIIIASFSEVHFNKKFDLILSNPPYFYQGEGRISPNLNKQICRTWTKDDLSILLHLIQDTLSPSGEAWLSLRADEKTVKTIESLCSRFKIYPQNENLIYVCVWA